MRKGKSERVTIFIDGSNFYHGVKDIKKDGLKIRLQEIVNDLVGSRELVTAFYYNALLDKKHDPETYVKSEDFCLLISGIKCPLISV